MRITYESPALAPAQVAAGLFMYLPGLARFEDVDVDEVLFDVEMVINMTHDGVRPTSISIEGKGDGTAITSVTLRRLKVWELTQLVLSQQVQAGKVVRADSHNLALDNYGRALAMSDDTVRRLREQGPTDETLEAVARFYNVGSVLSLAPAKFVEESLGLPRTTASKWVRRAREKGLISEPRTGDPIELLERDPRPASEVLANIDEARKRRGEHPEA